MSLAKVNNDKDTVVNSRIILAGLEQFALRRSLSEELHVEQTQVEMVLDAFTYSLSHTVVTLHVQKVKNSNYWSGSEVSRKLKLPD